MFLKSVLIIVLSAVSCCISAPQFNPFPQGLFPQGGGFNPANIGQTIQGLIPQFSSNFRPPQNRQQPPNQFPGSSFIPSNFIPSQAGQFIPQIPGSQFGQFQIPQGGQFQIPQGGQFQIPQGGQNIPNGRPGQFPIPQGGPGQQVPQRR